MIETRQIPRSDWNEFFAAFSQRHDDEAVALEVLSPDIGAQTEARDLHLRGISPTGHQEADGLAVLLDSPDGAHVTHMIAKPTHVWLQTAAGESEDALEIESADGTKTLLRFAPGTEGDAESPRIERFSRKGDDEDLG